MNTIDGGNTWTSAGTQVFDDIDDPDNAYFVDATTGWFILESGGVYHTRYGFWMGPDGIQPFVTSNQNSIVYFASSSSGWICRTNDGRIQHYSE